MSTPPLGFEFVADPGSYRDAAARLVRIPAGVLRKRDLLAIYARELELPSYFGWNWDALEECLRDLSWLSVGGVVIVHADLPLARSHKSQRVYVQLLRDVASHTAASPHPVAAVFPESSRPIVVRACD